ncbi:hypothetical protein EDD11_006381 [Mortierella claussenii]|nr:hypothetical protein EDD11_006381 [Mortierella claussenii]
MPSWPKSNSGDRPSKSTKPRTAAKLSKAQIIISMPRRVKEFGMGTFGIADISSNAGFPPLPLPMPPTSLSPITAEMEEQLLEQQSYPSIQLPKISDHALHEFGVGDTDPTDHGEQQQQQQTEDKTLAFPQHAITAAQSSLSIKASVITEDDGSDNSEGSRETSVGATTHQQQHTEPRSLQALQQFNSGFMRRDVHQPFSSDLLSSRTPGVTPTTLSTAGSRTPHPAKTSYCPNIPTTQTSSTSHTSTPHVYRQNRSQTFTSTGAIAPPSTPGGPSMEISSSAPCSSPSPLLSGRTSMPMTPGSMNEWRMMQIQLQQQDDLFFSLTHPSVNALSLNIPGARVMSMTAPMTTATVNAGGTTFGLGPLSTAGSTTPSASSSACSCCCCCVSNNSGVHHDNHLSSATNTTTMAVIAVMPNSDPSTTESSGIQSPVSEASAFEIQIPDEGSAVPKSILSTAAEAGVGMVRLTGPGTNGSKRLSWAGGGLYPQQQQQRQQKQQQQRQQHQKQQRDALYHLCNMSAASHSNDEGMSNQGLELQQPALLAGSTATLASSSSADIPDIDMAGRRVQGGAKGEGEAGDVLKINTNVSTSYGSSTTGSETPMAGFVNYPYLWPAAPASAVGVGECSGLEGATQRNKKHYRNCPHHQRQQDQHRRHSPRPSVGASEIDVAMAQSPTSIAVAGPGVGGTEMELSPSGSTSISFKSFSAKLATTTLRKLSTSQRPLFSGSKEDLPSGQGGDGANSSGTGYQFCQENVNMSREDLSEAGVRPRCEYCSHHNGRTVNAVHGHGQASISGGGSVCSEGGRSTSSTKQHRSQSKLSTLRSVTCSLLKDNRSDSDSFSDFGSTHGGHKKARRKSRTRDMMGYNHNSQLARQEFAQYNYERQIEDFQRAARVFKEQKALTTAAATVSIAASGPKDPKRGPQLQQSTEKSFSSSSTSLAIAPIQEAEEECSNSSVGGASVFANEKQDRHNADSGDSGSYGLLKGRKKLGGTRSGLLRSVSRPHRRVECTTAGSLAASPLYTNNHGMEMEEEHDSKNHVKTNTSDLELGQVGMSLNLDLKLPELGPGTGLGLDMMGTDMGDGNEEISGNISKDGSVLDIKTAMLHPSQAGTKACSLGVEDAPLNNISSFAAIAPSPSMQFLKDLPKRPEDVHSLIGRSSTISQDARSSGRNNNSISGSTAPGHSKAASNLKTGRSIHSVCSVDTVSQQISARHHQHSRHVQISSIAASLHSQSQPMQSSCESIYHRHCQPYLGAANTGVNNGDGCGGEGNDSVHGAGSGVVLENSPIQVVRATVGTVDDPSLPCFTFRMWVLSTIFVAMGAAISEYNFFRSNSAYFSIYFVQLASYFCGKAMARWLPSREFEIWVPDMDCMARRVIWNKSRQRYAMDQSKTGAPSDSSALSGDRNERRAGSHPTTGPIHNTNRSDSSVPNLESINNGLDTTMDGHQRRGRRHTWRFTLNPGKFNMKEHMLIGIAAAAGCSPAYATNVLAIQSLVFNAPLGGWTGIGLVLSSQCIGFSMAWLLFDYVIKPSVMLWPATLVNVSLYNTLHEHKVLTRWFTRMQLFWYAFFAVFAYQWLPRMFMPVLTSMALLCWVKPSSNVLRKLGSGYTGLGMGCISLDWSIISGVGPLYTPWWAQCNFFVGLITMLWVVTPIVYFSDYWSAQSYPIVSSNLYDSNAQLYDVSKIVNKDLSFNLTMYESYSPVIMTPYFAITYGTSFMAVVATFVHVALYYGADIWLIARTRSSRRWVRVKELAIVQAIASRFRRVNDALPREVDHLSIPSPTASVPRTTLEMDNVALRSVRSNNVISARDDILESGAGIGLGSIPELGSDDHESNYQSTQYHQISQKHDSFLRPSSVQMPMGQQHQQQFNCRPKVDDRDQIPTEMFGTEDIHTSLMRAYPEIPGWWFGLMFVICFTVAVLVCKTQDIRLPVYALILALLLAAVFALPMAIIQALSSSQIGLNVLSEVVCGYLLPGNQLGNSVFKCYSYMALYQCLNMTQGFKLGHYMKVPPRKIFIAVIYGTLLGAFVNLQVLEWVLLYNRQALFDAQPRSGWSFRNLDLFFSASLLWGAISPKRLFSGDSIYHLLPLCFLVGVFLPVPFYVMYRYYPPYGAMCKGHSPRFPFMPKCQCPADYIAASGEGDAAVVYPNPQKDFSSNLESGRYHPSFTGRVLLGQYWPSKKNRRQSKVEESKDERELMDKSEDAADATANMDNHQRHHHGHSNSNANADSFPSLESPSVEPTTASRHIPHLYYGHPGSMWEHRLRRFPWHLINTPLICVGASFVPQAPASFVVSAGIVAFCFAFLVLRYRHEWWRRYTFVLAAALDAGTQICNMAIFVVFSLILKGALEFPSWFGNDTANPEKCGVGDGYN